MRVFSRYSHVEYARVSMLTFIGLRRFRFRPTIAEENYGDPAYRALRMTYDAHF